MRRVLVLLAATLVVLPVAPAEAGDIVPAPERLQRAEEYDGVSQVACPERLRFSGNALSVNQYGQITAVAGCLQYDWLPDAANIARVHVRVAVAAPPGAEGSGTWRCVVNTANGNTHAPAARAEGCGFHTDDFIAGSHPSLEYFEAPFPLAADERAYLDGLMDMHCAYQECTVPRPADASSTHADAITEMTALGVMGLCDRGRFCPAEVVTRADMADFIARALGLPDPGGETFPDVSSSHPSAAAIRAIAARNITVGDAAGDFRPDVAVRRDQMATFLARALALSGGAASPAFADVPDEHTHRAGIQAVADAGITVGCGDGSRFCPADEIRRDQMATFLARAVR